MSTSRANRGKWAEKKVHEYLQKLSDDNAKFSFLRLPDARAALGRFKAMPADFSWYYPGRHGLIEVKEVNHKFRVPKANIPQLAQMKKRILSGGLCLVLIYFTPLKKWRGINAEDIPFLEGGSWDFSEYPLFDKVEDITIVKEITND